MKCQYQSTPSEASTGCDETGAGSIDILSSMCSEDDHAQLDLIGDEDRTLDNLPRGWSMRKGHMKRVSKPKMGKAAIWAEVHGQGKEVSKGRSAFKRSVNKNTSRMNWRCYVGGRTKADKRNTWHYDILWDTLEYESNYWHYEEDAAYNYEDTAELEHVPREKKPMLEPTIRSKFSDVDKLAQRLKPYGAILEKDSFQHKGGFVEMQKQLLAQHGPAFCRELSKSKGRTIHVKSPPVSKDVQERFLHAHGTLAGVLKVGYHGTYIGNLPSIYEKGLLIPGHHGNAISIANGSAHGIGIYTANVYDPGLSWGFCRANAEEEAKMIVCGILDDATHTGFNSYTMGTRTVHGESPNVRHVGSAMVIFDDRRVAPFFEVSLGELAPAPSQALPVFDWRRWLDKIARFFSAMPARKPKKRVPLMRKQEKQRTAIAYLARRAASKRNLKNIRQTNHGS